jgi:hypothetical protein
LTQTIPQKLDAIHRVVREKGQNTSKPFASVDTYVFQEITSMISDAGYGVQIKAPDLLVWGEHGSGNSGFYQGNEATIDELMAQLEIQ